MLRPGAMVVIGQIRDLRLDHLSATGPRTIEAANNTKKLVHPELDSGPPAKSSTKPAPHAPAAESPNPTVVCNAIVAPRYEGSADRVMPDVRAPESEGTVKAYTKSNARRATGAVPTAQARMIATNAEDNIRSVNARCRPNLIANSLPRMLDGMDSSENTTLTVSGLRSAVEALRATTNDQNATIHVRMP